MLPSPLHDRVLIKRIRVLIKRIEEQKTVKREIITPGTAGKSQEDEVVGGGAVKILENGFRGLVELRKAIGYFSKNIWER